MFNFLADLLSKYLRLTQFDIHKVYMKYKLKAQMPHIKGVWLDVGAGCCPYKKYFSSADTYLTTNTKMQYSPETQKMYEACTDYWIEDGSQLPVENQSLDGIACFQVLSVIKSPDLVFGEFNRVLKPGGKLLLSTDFMYPIWSTEDVYRHTANHIKTLAENNGFQVLKLESFGGFFSMLYAVIMRYIRSFPEVWKHQNGILKPFSAILYGIILLFLPIAYMKGFFISLFGKNITSCYSYTFNYWLVAQKK